MGSSTTLPAHTHLRGTGASTRCAHESLTVVWPHYVDVARSAAVCGARLQHTPPHVRSIQRPAAQLARCHTAGLRTPTEARRGRWFE